MTKISDREKIVLKELADVDADYAVYISNISAMTCLDYSSVRRAVRSLARKDMTELVRGLMDDDGYLRGSGYRCTKAGRALAAQL